ncbi:replication-relaxation family protein [Longimycelium tulufanense]|uniref:replication-relaxation family protein n=1 Tax=Longimycelium tulufanense TaxID=907463 RepID=UPI001E52BD23|nr:replication-relaxation family protein [Longimycelium tulufanense]
MVGGGRGGDRAASAASGVAGGSARVRRSESAAPSAEGRTPETAGRWRRRVGRSGGRLSGVSAGCHHPRGGGGRGGQGRRSGRAGEPDAGLWFRLVERDRRLLALLGEHRVLTTRQIAAIEFDSVRRAQDRLRQLRELGVVFAFRDSYPGGGTSQTRYALGYLGARLLAAQRAEPPPTPKAYTERLERLAPWPKLAHQLGVNQFFCELVAHTRRTPSTTAGASSAGKPCGVTQWWPEARCADFFWKPRTYRNIRPRPDAYGCWEDQGRTVRFFLEHDTGTEPWPGLPASSTTTLPSPPTSSGCCCSRSTPAPARPICGRRCAANGRATVRGSSSPPPPATTATRTAPPAPSGRSGHPRTATVELPCGAGWPSCRNGGRTCPTTHRGTACPTPRPPSTHTTAPSWTAWPHHHRRPPRCSPSRPSRTRIGPTTPTMRSSSSRTRWRPTDDRHRPHQTPTEARILSCAVDPMPCPGGRAPGVRPPRHRRRDGKRDHRDFGETPNLPGGITHLTAQVTRLTFGGGDCEYRA